MGATELLWPPAIEILDPKVTPTKGSEGSSIKNGEKNQGELVMGQNFSISLVRNKFDFPPLEMS